MSLSTSLIRLLQSMHPIRQPLYTTPATYLSRTSTTEATEDGHLRFLYGKFSSPFIFSIHLLLELTMSRIIWLVSPSLSLYAVGLLLSNRLIHERNSILQFTFNTPVFTYPSFHLVDFGSCMRRFRCISTLVN
jgi:hypothetical protein